MSDEQEYVRAVTDFAHDPKLTLVLSLVTELSYVPAIELPSYIFPLLFLRPSSPPASTVL
jgi:hypothetical protein